MKQILNLKLSKVIAYGKRGMAIGATLGMILGYQNCAQNYGLKNPTDALPVEKVDSINLDQVTNSDPQVIAPQVDPSANASTVDPDQVPVVSIPANSSAANSSADSSSSSSASNSSSSSSNNSNSSSTSNSSTSSSSSSPAADSKSGTVAQDDSTKKDESSSSNNNNNSSTVVVNNDGPITGFEDDEDEAEESDEVLASDQDDDTDMDDSQYHGICQRLAQKKFKELQDGASINGYHGKPLRVLGDKLAFFSNIRAKIRAWGKSTTSSLQSLSKSHVRRTIFCGMSVNEIKSVKGKIIVVNADIGDIDGFKGKIRVINGKISGDIKKVCGSIKVNGVKTKYKDCGKGPDNEHGKSNEHKGKGH